MSTETPESASPEAIEHAEAVWRILSEAIDSVPASDREAFLTRLGLLAALDHLSAEELATLVETARDAR